MMMMMRVMVITIPPKYWIKLLIITRNFWKFQGLSLSSPSSSPSLLSSPLERAQQIAAPHHQGRHSSGSGWSRLATPTTVPELFALELNSPLSYHELHRPGLRQKMSSSWLGQARFWLGQRKRQRRRTWRNLCGFYLAAENTRRHRPISSRCCQF